MTAFPTEFSPGLGLYTYVLYSLIVSFFLFFFDLIASLKMPTYSFATVL